MATSTTAATSDNILTATAAPSIVGDLAAEFTRFHGTEVLPLTDPRGGDPISVLVVPAGQKLVSARSFLDEFRGRPDRREGTARLLDLASFVAHANRFKDAHSALFADPAPGAPSITAVFDYHEALAGDREPSEALPRFGCHRAVYPFPLSEEWQAWRAIDGRTLTQQEFAQFLEDRIGDVILPPDMEGDEQLRALTETLGGRLGGPQSLHTLSRGLQVNVAQVVKQAVTLESGEIAIQYEEQHSDGAGVPIRTPNLFLLGIPVFYNGAPYRIPVRVRYRVQGGRISWSLHLYRADRAFLHAFDEVVKQAAEDTRLPLFVGAPEA